MLFKPHVKSHFPCIDNDPEELCTSKFELELRGCEKVICCKKCEVKKCKDLCIPSACGPVQK